MDKLYKINDYVIMKKPHACKTNLWQITRIGVDLKLKCLKCEHEIMMSRLEFERKVKKILGDNYDKIKR